MTERITERIGRKINNDIQVWYQDKVNEMAHFIVRNLRGNLRGTDTYFSFSQTTLSI